MSNQVTPPPPPRESESPCITDDEFDTQLMPLLNQLRDIGDSVAPPIPFVASIRFGSSTQGADGKPHHSGAMAIYGVQGGTDRMKILASVAASKDSVPNYVMLMMTIARGPDNTQLDANWVSDDSDIQRRQDAWNEMRACAHKISAFATPIVLVMQGPTRQDGYYIHDTLDVKDHAVHENLQFMRALARTGFSDDSLRRLLPMQSAAQIDALIAKRNASAPAVLVLNTNVVTDGTAVPSYTENVSITRVSIEKRAGKSSSSRGLRRSSRIRAQSSKPISKKTNSHRRK